MQQQSAYTRKQRQWSARAVANLFTPELVNNRDRPSLFGDGQEEDAHSLVVDGELFRIACSMFQSLNCHLVLHGVIVLAEPQRASFHHKHLSERVEFREIPRLFSLWRSALSPIFLKVKYDLPSRGLPSGFMSIQDS